MSIIAAGTTAGTALKSTGNTDGTIQLQVNGTTPSVTLATTGAIGVGSTPSYGTSGQVLTSAGSAAAPTWGTSVAPGFVYIASVSASASSTVDLFDYFSSTYDTYFLTINGLYMSASNWLQLQVRTGTTVQTGASSYSTWSNATAGASYNAAFGIAFEGSPTASTNQTSLYCYITNPNSTSQYKAIYGYAGAFTSTNVSNPASNFNIVWRGTTDALTGLRIFPAAGTITAGTFRLYGIKNS